MKMNTDEAWLLKKAAQEDGCLVSVGGLVDALQQAEPPSSNVIPMKHAFARFTQLARRDRSLSLETFAENVGVDLIELFKIETEEHYRPAIQTVHKIAEFLKVPEVKLMALAGLLQVEDAQFQTAALKFAARSVPVEKLTREEHSDLDGIVRILREQ